MTLTPLILTYNGIERHYTIERLDLTDDDPDYLDGEWYVVVERSQLGKKHVDYFKGPIDIEISVANAQVFANSANAKVDVRRWAAEQLVDADTIA